MTQASGSEFPVAAIAERLLQRHERLAVAESCTGGLIGKLLTDLAGSSAWFEGGLITYSNAMKERLLGVPAELLASAGAVSAQTALEMAEGARRRTGADWAIAVTGIAGPDGGSPDKPVGTVWIAWAGAHTATGATRFVFAGDRDAVRRQSAQAALQGLLDMLTMAESEAVLHPSSV